MKRSRLGVALSLMIISISLLVLLQFFWLKNAYETSHFDIRQDVNFMFRNVIYAVRDSTFSRSIESLPDDSAFVGQHPSDSVSAAIWELEKNDTGRVAKVILSINARDSVRGNVPNRIPPGLQLPRFNGGRRFVIRMMPDELSIDSIDFKLKASLKGNGIDLPVKVLHRHLEGTVLQHSKAGFHPFELPEDMPKERDRADIFCDTVRSEFVMYNPMNHYAASVAGVRVFIVKQIAPQIMFSIFLTSLTSISFLFLYRSIRSQQRLVEMKNDFISNVTHELKTPVATVSVALEALKNFHAIDNPRLTQEYLAIAQGEIARLSQMTDKILTASIDHENESLRVAESVNIDNLIQDVLSSMKVVIEKRNGMLSYIKEGTNFEIKGESIHITNVINNLIDNALKYSPGRPEIVVSLRNSSGELMLSVRDKGIGIAPEYQERIFEKFFRVPSGDVHNTKGYGLGLSYVRDMVKRQGGKIKVESRPGEGSEFIIIFHRSE